MTIEEKVAELRLEASRCLLAAQRVTCPKEREALIERADWAFKTADILDPRILQPGPQAV